MMSFGGRYSILSSDGFYGEYYPDYPASFLGNMMLSSVVPYYSNERTLGKQVYKPGEVVEFANHNIASAFGAAPIVAASASSSPLPEENQPIQPIGIRPVRATVVKSELVEHQLKLTVFVNADDVSLSHAVFESGEKVCMIDGYTPFDFPHGVAIVVDSDKKGIIEVEAYKKLPITMSVAKNAFIGDGRSYRINGKQYALAHCLRTATADEIALADACDEKSLRSTAVQQAMADASRDEVVQVVQSLLQRLSGGDDNKQDTNESN